MSMTSKDIVSAIIDDLTDRSGLGDVWNEIDKDTKKEIVSSWKKIIDDYFKHDMTIQKRKKP